MTKRLGSCELQIDLFCRGVHIDPSCLLERDARFLARTRAGLGSGLELVVPGKMKDFWMNVPVEEDFVHDSPYSLLFRDGGYRVADERTEGLEYDVRIPAQPDWYTRRTARGTEMSRVGVLQGTYLGIYLSNSCSFWYHKPNQGCKFCTTGHNVGVNEVAQKDVADVVEVCRAAKEESGATFVHFNSGFAGKDRGLDEVAPYVHAVKKEVGLLTGVQVTPSPNLWKYDWLVDCGADHFSFCYEFHNPEYFAKYLPGKENFLGQETFFRALEYTAGRMGKGRVSGEIIAGVEPVEDTLKAIDYIAGVGAFPTVCIFRPTIGAEMERHPAPRYEDMRVVMEHMWDACRRNSIPIGAAPNIEVSLIVTPDDARDLPEHDWKWRAYEAQLTMTRLAAKPHFARELRPRTPKGDPTRYPESAPAPVKARTPEADELAREAGVLREAPAR